MVLDLYDLVFKRTRYNLFWMGKFQGQQLSPHSLNLFSSNHFSSNYCRPTKDCLSEQSTPCVLLFSFLVLGCFLSHSLLPMLGTSMSEAF